MNKILTFIFFALTLLTLSFTSTAQTQPQHLMCESYWNEVAFRDFCTMKMTDYDFEGENDICNARSNDSYDNDELIYIRVYNNYTEANAEEEFETEREAYDNSPKYSELPGLGDDAFAATFIELGKIDHSTIIIRKGIYTVSIEVNGNIANNSNNCFSLASIYKFAEVIIDPL